MFFNLDRQKKLKLLNYYKKEALDSQRKKEAEKKLKIQDELNYLHKKELEELENEKKTIQEQNKKKKALMQDYLQMLKKTKNNIPGFHLQKKNKDVIINNWGKTKEEFLSQNNNCNIYDRHKSNDYSIDNNFNSLSQIEKARRIIKPIDSMNQFLTDEQNVDKVNLFFLKRKIIKKDFYKNLLFSQHEESDKLNKNRYGTNDILILKQKKKNLLTDNPYRRKYQLSFGNSNLENNPILNPSNNIKYNKYLKNFFQENINQNINNMFKSNDFYNGHKKYNYTIERTHNNMTINGNKIKNNFDKDEKIVRNFSGIFPNDLKLQNNEFNINGNKSIKKLNLNDINNKILTSRSMSSENFI